MNIAGKYYMVVYLDENERFINMEVLYVSPFRTVEQTARGWAEEQGFTYSSLKYKYNRDENPD